ncbi:DUF3050 domain-containing protein [Marinicrinis sediminis]|uniref:DUF3050 domain-containing protein n=1 Tax=Marinicrinis sediminis TaxID=1652465 RepID=A0ABW5RDN0_9BACL
MHTEQHTHQTARFEEARQMLLQHRIYSELHTPERVRIFMKHHVFAVWDFMSLLKKLQLSVTSVTVPWMPYAQPSYTRFINEIVLAEESDEDGQGGYVSHFELYLAAMEQTGADTAPIQQFMEEIRAGQSWEAALQHEFIPPSVRKFVGQTLQLAMNGQTHEVASAFFYGREDLIPDMFQALMEEMRTEGADYDRLTYYLQRHIELDGDEHGPLAERLLQDLCGDNRLKEEEAMRVAALSLEARIHLWDGVLEEIERLER